MSAAGLPRKFTPFFPDDDRRGNDATTRDEWISTLYWGLDALLAGRPDACVVREAAWFFVASEPDRYVVPDVMVIFGREKDGTGSYRQWEYGGTPPAIVMDVWTPEVRLREFDAKRAAYENAGVDESYAIEPVPPACVSGRLTIDGRSLRIEDMTRWVSPKLGIRFETKFGHLNVVRPDGTRFLQYADIRDQLIAAERRADRLAAKLRELGVDLNGA